MFLAHIAWSFTTQGATVSDTMVAVVQSSQVHAPLFFHSFSVHGTTACSDYAKPVGAIHAGWNQMRKIKAVLKSCIYF